MVLRLYSNIAIKTATNLSKLRANNLQKHVIKSTPTFMSKFQLKYYSKNIDLGIKTTRKYKRFLHVGGKNILVSSTLGSQ